MTDPAADVPHVPDAPHVTVTATTDGTAEHVHVRGEIDATSAPLVLRSVQEVALRTAGPVVLHLGDVTFIDSCGVQALLDAHRGAGASPSRVWLGSISPPVRRVLHVTNLIDEFRIWPDPISDSRE